ncbi:MAG: hypothetical protein BWY26_01323 [Elusimicrobia bacterium ADurb.Bin231]|nr:MAG: hypothetical protein BWY26_01323 [Elusimicrobia bacterium ADurb.Bin231]
MASVSRSKKFADIIVENAIITREQLTILLEKQRSVSRPLSQLLVEAGYVNEEEISKTDADRRSTRPNGSYLRKYFKIGS